MKKFFRYFIYILFAASITGCMNYKKYLTDEVILKDGNSHTGTLIKVDSVYIKLKHIDESVQVIPWSSVDSVQGKKLKTFFLGMNLGYYKSPYFSVFRNEPFAAEGLGFQLKGGFAIRGIKMYYIHLTHVPSRPYPVTKYGFGYQRYLGRSTYLRKNTFFVGGEFNLMNVRYNNAPQATMEPFTGFDKKLNEHLRIHFKLGLQFNLANKNTQTGVNATIGIHFMKRNFRQYYQTLNSEHRLPRK